MLVFGVRTVRLPHPGEMQRPGRRPCFRCPRQTSRGHNQPARHRGHNLTDGAVEECLAALASCLHEQAQPWASCCNSSEADSPRDVGILLSRKYRRGVKPVGHWRMEALRVRTRKNLRWRVLMEFVQRGESGNYLFPCASSPMLLRLREGRTAVMPSSLPGREGSGNCVQNGFALSPVAASAY